MRAFLATVLSVIAVGVLLIAYGLLAPRASASSQVMYDPQTGMYQLVQPAFAGERIDRAGFARPWVSGGTGGVQHSGAGHVQTGRLHPAGRVLRTRGSCCEDNPRRTRPANVRGAR